MEKKKKKALLAGFLILMLCLGFVLSVQAEGTGPSVVVQKTWNEALGEIKAVVNGVVFPAMDVILGILFFVKLAMCYMEYRKRNQFDFTGPAILFASLVFCLTAPLYLWEIIG